MKTISKDRITHQDLLDFGFKKTVDNSVDSYELPISEASDDLDPMTLVVTNLYNEPEFCLLLCEGERLYLNPVPLSELKTFIECINRYEPVW